MRFGKSTGIRAGQRCLRSFFIRWGAASYWLIALLGMVVSFFTFGLGTPWALCWYHKWRCSHTMIGGRRLEFTGGGFSLIGLWIKWIVFLFLTLGIYSFWMVPSLNKWVVEHTRFKSQ